jgi:PadR family transcriptional regulator PadR
MIRTPLERFQKTLTKDNLWIYILKLLQKKEMYPYEIRDKIEKEFNFKPGNVTAYIVLKKLKIGGYVKVSKTKKEQGPERTYYKITEKGKEELRKAIKFYRNQIKNLENIN